MRIALNLPPRSRRRKKNPQLQCADALHACEVAADQVKCASDELAARWVTLARELSAGVPNTDLLRTRAWCNVLELRLKERASALEMARQLLDGVWREVMPGAASGPGVGFQVSSPGPSHSTPRPAHAAWPLYAQAITASATQPVLRPGSK